MLYCCLFNSGLLSVILFNCFYSQPDLSALLKRVEALETQSRPDISTHMRQLSSYGLRSEADFDKYHAVTLAEAAAVEAHRAADPKAYFLDAACQTLRSSLSRPTDRFKAYFLALFSDKDYTKILDSIAKVEKRLIVILKVVLHKMLPGQFHLVWREQPALYVLIVASQVTLLLIVGN